MQSAKIKQQKRRQLWYVLILLAVVLFSYSLFDFWSGYKQAQNHFIHYDAFGIDVPLGYTLHGIDVSRHQGVISWRAVKAMQVKDIQFNFVFIKATEGVSMVDMYYKRNWANCIFRAAPIIFI